MRRFSISICAAAFSIGLYVSTALAAEEKVTRPTLDRSNMASGNYVLDPEHARLSFSVDHLGFSYYQGRFNRVDATVMYRGGNPEKSAVKLTVDLASVDTHHAQLEDKLRSEDFFDVDRFPTASFTSTSLRMLNDAKGEIEGVLSLHGVSRPVRMQVIFRGYGINPYTSKPTLGLRAYGSIKRSEFGIKKYMPAVGDEVRIQFDAEFGLSDA